MAKLVDLDGLSRYNTKLNDKLESTYAKKEEIPDVSDSVTEEFVKNEIANAQLASEGYVESKLSEYVNKTNDLYVNSMNTYSDSSTVGISLSSNKNYDSSHSNLRLVWMKEDFDNTTTSGGGYKNVVLTMKDVVRTTDTSQDISGTKNFTGSLQKSGEEVATQPYVGQLIADLINSAPETLDTIGELATAITENKDIMNALNNAIGTKANQTDLNTTNTNVSGLATKVSSLETNKADKTQLFSGSYNDLSNKPTIPTALSQLTQNASYRTVTDTEKETWNSKSNFSGSYNDLTNKPTIPTVNNATLTIQKNGTNVGTFTSNASSNSTINITVPTGTASDKNVVTAVDSSANLPTSNAVKTFVEGKGYLTSITSSLVTTALGYTPYNSTNPNGYITSSGSITGNAFTATKATNDGNGNNIASTYATNSSLTSGLNNKYYCEEYLQQAGDSLACDYQITIRLRTPTKGNLYQVGIQIVFGLSYAGGGTGRTITYSRPFADTNYGVVANMFPRTSKTTNGWNYVETKTTTTTRFICGDDKTLFIAIGTY